MSAVSESFEGKKKTNCMNLIVALTTNDRQGITMEPIQQAKAAGKVPPGIYLRRYGESKRGTGQLWE